MFSINAHLIHLSSQLTGKGCLVLWPPCCVRRLGGFRALLGTLGSLLRDAARRLRPLGLPWTIASWMRLIRPPGRESLSQGRVQPDFECHSGFISATTVGNKEITIDTVILLIFLVYWVILGVHWWCYFPCNCCLTSWACSILSVVRKIVGDMNSEKAQKAGQMTGGSCSCLQILAQLLWLKICTTGLMFSRNINSFLSCPGRIAPV